MPGWLPWAAACAACAAFLLVLLDAGLWHPGYAYGDERVEICMLQALREGAPFAWDFGRGCLSRAVQWLWVGAAGTDLGSLHTPELAALALEFLCLVLLARRWFGDEVAAWSVLALALSAQTWVWARSLLAFQALPAETLLLGLLAGRVRGRGGAFVWGLAASLSFLDYDGALIAVPGLWLACAALDPAFRRRAAFSALGLALGGLALFWHGQASLAAYAALRLGRGLAASTDPGWAGRLRFLKDLAVGGDALPYFGVGGWPAWPPWAWVGLALGSWQLRRSPGLALVLWAVGAALATQMVHSGYGFPLHRLVAAVPALALITGVGLRRLRVRLGSGAWVLALLLVAGAAGEGWAWWRHQQAFAPELYDRCDSLALARTAYRRDLEDPSVRVVTQLSGSLQADARFVLDRPLALGSRSDRVLAFVPADYAPALKGLGLQGAWFWAAKGLEPALVVEASGARAVRLASIEDSLAPLVGNDWETPRECRRRLDAWLSAPQARDPWTLTAALEADFEDSLRDDGTVSAQVWSRLAGARPLSAAPWMALARSVYGAEPRAAVAYCREAESLDPADGEALLIEAASLRALGDPRAAGVSRAWVSLRASGTGWRHTQ